MDRIRVNSAVLLSNMPPTVQIIQIYVKICGLASGGMNMKRVLPTREQAVSFMELHRLVHFIGLKRATHYCRSASTSDGGQWNVPQTVPHRGRARAVQPTSDCGDGSGHQHGVVQR